MKNRLLFIYLAFGLSFIVIIIISLLLLKKFTSINESNFWIEHTHEVKNQILKVEMNLIEAENSQRGFLLTEDTVLLQPLTRTQKIIFKEIDSLKQLTRDNKEQQEIVKKLKETVSLRYQVLYATINNIADGRLHEFLKNRERGDKIMQEFMRLSQQMDNVESELLKERKKQQSLLEFAAPWYLGMVLLVSLFFQLVSFIIIIGAFKRRQVHQKLLENKIKELNATNAELEQIAFVVSHDLQEPLRKMRIFVDKLVSQYKSILNEEGKMIAAKISSSSARMQELLNDLINYTQVTKNEGEVKQVDLNQTFDEARRELDDIIKQKNAVIRVDYLPTVDGHHKQLYLLFYNLLDNALKFSKANTSPVIHVSASLADGREVGSANMFTKITFNDNGTGFKNDLSKKIFILFRRFHSTDSPVSGKGIGLAICKKVMLNHNGYISAQGEPGEGATFYVYFPAGID